MNPVDRHTPTQKRRTGTAEKPTRKFEQNDTEEEEEEEEEEAE